MVSTRSGVLAVLALAGLAGCGATDEGQPSAADIPRPVDTLHALAAADPLLAAKLELDPSVRQGWWTRPGRWDDPSRRIRVDWGPLGLILYPSTALQLPGALVDVPLSLIRAIFVPKDDARMEQLRRLGEEAAERAYPLEGRPPK